MKLLWLAVPAAIGAAVLGIANLPSERIVSSYATPIDGRSASQRHNARMALEELNGVRILPGEEFSFNKTVGTFSRDAGYRKAPVSYNGTLIDDWGGGVCQASTTLYNTALLAGMELTERHRHQFQPSYVPAGRDAAVAFSHIDLRFRNPYDFPVRIEAKITGGVVRVDMIASHPLPHKPSVFTDILSTKQPWTFATDFGEGRRRVRNSGKVGFEVAVYRTINGKRELISQDNYPVMHRVTERR